MKEKKKSADLALFGGGPAFEDKVHVGRPNIGDREKLLDTIGDVIDRYWLTNHGPNVREFENRIAEMTGVDHCIAMNNGTQALEITIRTAGLSGEVIVPSFTFIATAHALQWQHITPLFCDIDPGTHNIDPDKVEQMITPQTTGIIGVHLWGRPCAVEALEEIAERHELKLIFDAAHAFGCSHGGRMIGNFGRAEIFSFHATKFFNTFEGGAVVTNDAGLAGEIRLARNFGFAGYDNVIRLGINAKMNEVSAAMGLVGLESVDEFIGTNHQNYLHYQQELKEIPWLSLVTYDESEKCNYQYIVIEIDSPQSHIGRDLLIDILHAENVLARRYFYPGCHRMEPYRSSYSGPALPATEKLSESVISLPNGSSVDRNDISLICNIIRFAIENGPEVTEVHESADRS